MLHSSTEWTEGNILKLSHDNANVFVKLERCFGYGYR